MSANNWAVCPQCQKRAYEERVALQKKARSCYGKVPEDEYNEMVKAAAAPVVLEETLREDYEIGIESDGTFYAIYSASCKTCGFSFKFKHEEQV